MCWDNINDNNDTCTSITQTNSDNKRTEKATTKETDTATTNVTHQANEEVEINEASEGGTLVDLRKHSSGIKTGSILYR